MSLRLRVVSEQRLLLGPRASVEFPEGGTIGRASDNDWVLPDPQRYVSGHHARVRRRDGRYVLEDLSTNGVYVNGVKAHSAVLHDGDTLQIGDVVLVFHEAGR